MAKFITGKELDDEVCNVIHSAKKQLLILSPYVKLDDYFKNLFSKHKNNSELHILIAFGKNKRNPERSFNSEDLKYFTDFPNVSIVYIPNLHAKYYANEKKGIVTSINLYDYSFKNNVEFGVVSESKLIGGSALDKDAWESTMKILKDGYAVFIKRPNYKKKFFIAKDYLGSDTLLDLTQTLLNGVEPEKHNVFDFMDKTFVEDDINHERITREEFERQNLNNQLSEKRATSNDKLLSATNLGKLKDKTYDEVIAVMVEKGYIVDKNTISVVGSNMGIQYKEKPNGDKWIVYPESLAKIL
ncbi:MAG: phospholipase D-like domain-containing protein [Bacteroidota bacterium]|nr:phospholipase D-like domain-containing protein [Bacteroidota bacterium]